MKLKWCIWPLQNRCDMKRVRLSNASKSSTLTITKKNNIAQCSSGIDKYLPINECLTSLHNEITYKY